MENLNEVISKKLIKFRVEAGLTQLELAQKINYSDKSISKWERGDGLPDLPVLVALSEIYNITLNDFLSKEKVVKSKPKKTEKKSRLLVCLLSTGLVMLIASICFAILFMIPKTQNYAWYSYLFSIPVCAIVLLVFSEVWGNRYLNTLFASVIVWGIILSVCLTVPLKSIWIICIIGLVLTILIIFWYILRFLTIQKKKSLKFLNNIFTKNKNSKTEKKPKKLENKLDIEKNEKLVYNELTENSNEAN